MPAIARGQASSCTNPVLDVFFRQGGSLIDVHELEFQIFDVSTVERQVTPVQVYPAVHGERAPVDVATLCPAGDKLSTGRFVGRWTPALSEPLGTHRITWIYRVTEGSAEQSWSEDFEVLSEASAGGSDGYCTVQDMRDEGVTEAMCSTARLSSLILLASRRIDALCSGWFAQRSVVMLLDGTGTALLELPVPIISVTSIEIDGVAIDAETFVVYNRHMAGECTEPDDRRWPRIELVQYTGQIVGGLYFRESISCWPIGKQNIRITGAFGWTESDGSTPVLIQQACKLMVVQQLAPMVDSAARAEEANRGREKLIRTREQTVEYFEGGSTVASGVISGDAQIDALLAEFLPAPRMSVIGSMPYYQPWE